MTARTTRIEPSLASNKPRSNLVLHRHATAKHLKEELPRISPVRLKLFTWYSRRYVRKHFHSVRLAVTGPPASWPELPVVLYSNHASWWDPLVCLLIKAEFFFERVAFAPIDAGMLERYQFFRKLGFFPVERQTRRGARQFLQTASAILQSPKHLLALTPQSRFADARERPPRFESGIGHLAVRAKHALFVPVAVEYVYWEERLPEILLRFGEPIEVGRHHNLALDAKDWTRLFEQRLLEAQDFLSVESQRRNPANFRILIRGGAGQGGVYDWWRSSVAKLRGKTFSPEHGGK